MPYKDIEKRREAWRRWARKNKEKRRFLNRVQNQAYNHHPIRRKCSIRNCKNIGERHHEDYTKPKEIIWFCKYHHELIHKKQTRLCIIEDCCEIHHAKGYCSKHLHRWKKGKL